MDKVTITKEFVFKNPNSLIELSDMVTEINNLERAGYMVTSMEPIEEIKVVTIGKRFVLEKGE